MTRIFEANGARFIAQDDMIVRWLEQGNGPFEPATLVWMLARLAERPGLYLDAGASTGWFAIPVAMTGRETVAIECNPRVIARLRDNIALNAVDIELHPVAASDKAGEVVFRHNPRWPLTSGGSLEQGIGGHRAQDTVRAATLDSLVGDRDVALMKMDVEGHEMAALAGAQRILERSRPFLLLEANTSAHEQALAGLLKGLDYTYEKADERNMLCSPRF